MSVYKKLNDAREEFHQLKLVKTGENKFAKYKYFELGDFLIPALGLFKKHGLCGLVSFTADTASMTIVDVEDGSQHVISSPMGSADLKGCHVVQNIGAVETYQRRYLWVAALEIVEHDALDATTGAPTRKAEPAGIKHSPRDGIGEDLPEDWKIYLRDLADEVRSKVAAGKPQDACSAIDGANLEADQKTWMWGLLDAPTRSAIKVAARVPA